MPRITRFEESSKTVPELLESAEKYLDDLQSMFGPLDGVSQWKWNYSRDQLTITGPRFTCKILLTSKGVLGVVDLSILLMPFRERIESFLGVALGRIANGTPENKQKDSTGNIKKQRGK